MVGHKDPAATRNITNASTERVVRRGHRCWWRGGRTSSACESSVLHLFRVDAHADTINTDINAQTRNENYSVHVVLPNNEVFIYTNISKQRLKPHVKGPISTVPAPAPNPSYRASTQPRSSATSGSTGSETFEDVMRSGGQIVEVKKFTTYGVYMRMPTDGRIVHCWNISQDRVDAARRHIAIETDFTPPTKPHSGHSSAATSGGSKRSQNPSFEECIQQCATIVRVTPHVFYSIHVQRPNGRVENFNRVSHEKVHSHMPLR